MNFDKDLVKGLVLAVAIWVAPDVITNIKRKVKANKIKKQLTKTVKESLKGGSIIELDNNDYIIVL